jgi:hypothetical protein
MNLPAETWPWWQSRRRFYNFALLAAGLAAFLCYVAAVEFSDPREPDGIEITAFTVVGQAFGYLLMIAVANLFYMAGPLAEKIVQPRNVVRFRSRLFATGLWFSVALPFVVPLTVIFKHLGKSP